MAITKTNEPDQVTASNNDCWITVNTTDASTHFKKEIYGRPEYILIATHITPANASGNDYYILKGILQSRGVAPDILNYQLPVFNQLSPATSVNNIKGYSLTFYTLDKTTGDQVTSLPYNNNSVVLLAGNFFLQGNTKLVDIIRTGATKRKFLTSQPHEKTTTENSQEYLYYYHNETGISSGAVSLSLKVIIMLNDKTSIEKILLPFTISDKQVCIFPAGLSQLNLHSYVTGGKKITAYSVCLVLSAATANPVTETYLYSIDTRCFPTGREFIFLNSLGGIGMSIPVILTDSNYTLQKNRASLQNIQFGCRYAFDELGYNNF